MESIEDLVLMMRVLCDASEAYVAALARSPLAELETQTEEWTVLIQGIERLIVVHKRALNDYREQSTAP